LTIPRPVDQFGDVLGGGSGVCWFDLGVIRETVCHDEDRVKSFRRDKGAHEIESHLRESVGWDRQRMEETGRSLCGGFVATARGAGFDVKFDVPLYSRPVIVCGD
jgi:hypothetical protein